MPEIKPVVAEQPLLELLERQFGQPVTALQPIAGGHIAQTFVFSSGGQEYVIRFNTNKMDANFEKEEYIANNFGSALIPIPTVIRVGRLQDLHYCISRKAIGQRLDRLSPQEIHQALGSVMETLDAIHATDVSRQEAYGLFDGQGKGFFPSWPASLEYVKEEERPDGFYGKWHHLFETSFLDRRTFDRVYAMMENLLSYCPNDRYLVHGGYGFGNLLVVNGRVTAVLDWLDAKYGDFVYDVAWLDFWDSERGYRELFQAHYAEQGTDVSNLERRLLCYQCYIALDGMRFFAKSDKADAYQWTRDHILSLITT